MNYDPNTGQPIYNGNQQPVQPQQQGGTNGFAIAGLIVSIFVSALVGLILSIIGLSKSKTLNNGKGLAIAGIVISIIKMVLTVIIVIVCWGLILGLFGIVSSYEEYCTNPATVCSTAVGDYAECKYKDGTSTYTFTCPKNLIEKRTTEPTTKTTKTTKVNPTVAQEFNITDTENTYYANKFYLQNYNLYAVPTSAGKKYVNTGSTVNGVACAEIVKNVTAVFIVEGGQSGMQHVIIVDGLGQAYRIVNTDSDTESFAFDFVKIPNAKPISKVYSLLVPDAIGMFYLNTSNQLVPTGDGYLEIDKKNGYYENKIGSDVYKVEVTNKDNSYVYFNVYKNSAKIAENAKIQYNDGMATYDEVDGIYIAMCSGNKFGVDCN
jgi:hypothetical protein